MTNPLMIVGMMLAAAMAPVWAAEKVQPAEAGANPPATIAWGEAVDGVQVGLVPLGGVKGDGWGKEQDLFHCPRCAQDVYAAVVNRTVAAQKRVCAVCVAPKPWGATFAEGQPMVFEVHLRNAGDKNVIVGGVSRWFTFVFTPAGGGVPRQATYTTQAAESPPGGRELPSKGYWAFVEGVGGGSAGGTWRFEDARPNRDGSLRPIPALPPGKYSVTARYGDHHPEHAPDAPCRFWHGKIATGPVEIEIKPGEPETDAQRKARQEAEAKPPIERKQQIDRERELKQRAIREVGP